MPLSAIAADHPDAVVSAARMAAVVAEKVERMKGMPADEPMQDGNDERELALAVDGLGEVGCTSGPTWRRASRRGCASRGVQRRVAHYEGIVREAEVSSRVIQELLTMRDASAA